MIDSSLAQDYTRRWLSEFVVGLNLCPFARPLLGSDQLRIAVCGDSDRGCLQRAFLSELDLLQSTPESEIATSLLVYTGALQHFDDYLDFLALAQDLLVDCGLEGLVQLASFHPDYRFEGEAKHAASHFSNRAPFPTIHLIREDMLERVLADFRNPEAIPGRNMATLDALGTQKLERRWLDLFS